MNGMKMKTTHKALSISAVTLGVCLLLLSVINAIASDGFCKSPQSDTVNSIKANLVAEINETEIVKSSEERKMKPEDVKILQAYEKDGFVLVSYQYSCCFEGMVVLFKKSEKRLKEIGYFNGYDPKGVYEGFERKLVVRSLSKLVPLKVKKMIACYKD